MMDISELSIIADFFVICSGESERQISALSEAIVEATREHEVKPLHQEGDAASGWILLDYGSTIVHIFSPENRSYYDIEDLWSEAKTVVRFQ
jgi:ribosome-associated protein